MSPIDTLPLLCALNYADCNQPQNQLYSLILSDELIISIIKKHPTTKFKVRCDEYEK